MHNFIHLGHGSPGAALVLVFVIVVILAAVRS
jgi:hypothetical protein